MKDSALTVHGHLQAERLGKYFAGRGLKFTHVFSSDLQRAYKTACAIQKACTLVAAEESKEGAVLQLEILREQDFGFYEGKPFYARPRTSDKSGKEDHRLQHQNDADFKDVESKESMSSRTDLIVVQHLIPILTNGSDEEDTTVVLVSHGIILNHLWRSILKRFSQNSVALLPGLSVSGGGSTPLEYLGGWSNTGYLELEIVKKSSELLEGSTTFSTGPSAAPKEPAADIVLLQAYKMTIKVVNGKEHLTGLNRTRNVGSSQHDEGQRNIESFFKKRKA